MTDTTELALRLKLEVHRAVSNFNPQMNIKTRDLKELVEALEKAQAGEKQWREVVDAFCADDSDWHKLTNSNNELIALLSQALCKQADRIAELESRTVTVENLQESAYRAGLTAGWNLGLANNNDGFNKCLAAHRAGIKVEAE
ncbi:TPA: hypothetical protein ACX3LH_006065 [Klebsiella michiganensis]